MAASYPLLKSIQTQSINGHGSKSDGKSSTSQQSKSGSVNGEKNVETSTQKSSYETTYHSSKLSEKQNIQSPDIMGITSNVSNGQYVKPGLDSRSKLNGRVMFAPPFGIREKLKRDSEEELKLSKAQIGFFNIVAKCIIEGHHCLYQVGFVDFLL